MDIVCKQCGQTFWARTLHKHFCDDCLEKRIKKQRQEYRHKKSGNSSVATYHHITDLEKATVLKYIMDNSCSVWRASKKFGWNYNNIVYWLDKYSTKWVEETLKKSAPNGNSEADKLKINDFSLT